ncbi:unnamed protein product [Orchesella dallaii]|uniref:Gustatory receptor n=1 Tax=Orchesella dallaii TaxID=48710 RepID=A0ABP1QI70_9HEXA
MVLGNLYNVISFCMITDPNQRKEYNLGYVGIHIIAVIAMFNVFGHTLLACKNTTTIYGVNEFLRWETGVTNHFRGRERTEIFDILLHILNIVATGVPFVIFLAVLFEFDPLFYVFEDFILTPKMYRPALQVFLGLVTRSVVMIGAFECARTLTFISFVFLVVVNRMSKVALMLLGHEETTWSQQIVRYYKEFVVVYRIYKSMFSDFLSLMITSIFWLVVTIFWVTIKGYGTIPFFMYLLIITLGLSFLCVAVVALDLLSTLDERSSHVVLKCRKESKLECFMSNKVKRIEKQALIREAKALHPIAILYSPFSRINKEFLMSLLQSIVDRLVDALVLFG